MNTLYNGISFERKSKFYTGSVCMYVRTLKSSVIMSRSGIQWQDAPEVIRCGLPLEFLESFLQYHSVLGNLQVHVHL